MKEFIDKQTGKTEEKVKATSLELIVTGTKDKPYFEIKYKEVGKEDYNIGYSSYDLNNVFGWKEECFEIVNQLAEEYSANTPQKSAIKTNADRIRAMNDDELTDFIFNIGMFEDDGEVMKYIDEDYIVHDDCTSILEWLQSKAEKE